jgi:hypothetical protein
MPVSSANDVTAVIDEMVARGVFRATPRQVGAGETAIGAIEVASWRIKWFSGHEMRLHAFDHAANHEIRVDDVLPPLPAQSQLYRDLRAWLKEQQSADLPAHRRIDPAQITLAVRNSGGQIRLSLSSRDETLPALAKRAVQLVHAVYLDFLNGPGRLEWVTEAFGLDPDNPRFS